MKNDNILTFNSSISRTSPTQSKGNIILKKARRFIILTINKLKKNIKKTWLIKNINALPKLFTSFTA